MDLRQVGAKIYAKPSSTFDEEQLIPAFHRWIREKFVQDHLLIDVADYRHVPDGPGVMLIAHEAHWSVDRTVGALGLRYQSKRDDVGDAKDKIKHAIRNAFIASNRLESEVKGFKPSPNKLCIQVLSRLHLKNDKASFDGVKSDIDSVFEELFVGNSYSMKLLGDERAPFAVDVTFKNDIPWAEVKKRI